MGHSTEHVHKGRPNYRPAGHRGDLLASLLWRRAEGVARERSKLSETTLNCPFFQVDIGVE